MTETKQEPRRTSLQPICWECDEVIDGQRVVWAHRAGKLRPLHPTCAHPTVQRNGIVIR